MENKERDSFFSGNFQESISFYSDAQGYYYIDFNGNIMRGPHVDAFMRNKKLDSFKFYINKSSSIKDEDIKISTGLKNRIKKLHNKLHNKFSAFPLDKGEKDDSTKLRMDLISPIAMEQLSQVLTHGADKYAPNNWRKGIKFSRLIAAAKRHLNKFEAGEDTDEEVGTLHLANAMCNLMMLIEFYSFRKDLDDRFDFKNYKERP